MVTLNDTHMRAHMRTCHNIISSSYKTSNSFYPVYGKSGKKKYNNNNKPNKTDFSVLEKSITI